MSVTTNANASTNLIDRVRKILVEPQNEWPVIEAESTDVQKLYVEYVAILAAIPPIFSFLAQAMFGRSVGIAIVTAIVLYALSLVSVFVAAFIIDKLAPTFASRSNLIQAMKLVAYASTATYVAGVFQIIPFLGPLVGFVAALYGIYLFYLGLPVLMKTPQDRVIPYMLVAAVVMIVLWVLVAMVTGAIMGMAILASL